MADGSAIEWTEATWNPTTGCDRITAGCDNCYALTLAKRLKAMGAAKYQTDGDPRTSGPGFGDRKSTRLNSSHLGISYDVFCLKKKTKYDDSHHYHDNNGAILTRPHLHEHQ